jgi:predicted RNA-binding Zn-ribbon protein involved in translation (DUF1610 family)
MTKTQKPCSKCQGEMRIARLESFSGEEGAVKITVRDMPALVCKEKHKRFVYPEFAPALMDIVIDPESYRFLPSANRQGLLRKHYHCTRCGAELPAAASADRSRDLDADLKDAEPFAVKVTVPVYACPKCGTEHLHSAEEVGRLAFKAIAHGFRAIDIHPT